MGLFDSIGRSKVTLAGGLGTGEGSKARQLAKDLDTLLRRGGSTDAAVQKILSSDSSVVRELRHTLQSKVDNGEKLSRRAQKIHELLNPKLENEPADSASGAGLPSAPNRSKSPPPVPPRPEKSMGVALNKPSSQSQRADSPESTGAPTPSETMSPAERDNAWLRNLRTTKTDPVRVMELSRGIADKDKAVVGKMTRQVRREGTQGVWDLVQLLEGQNLAPSQRNETTRRALHAMERIHAISHGALKSEAGKALRAIAASVVANGPVLEQVPRPSQTTPADSPISLASTTRNGSGSSTRSSPSTRSSSRSAAFSPPSRNLAGTMPPPLSLPPAALNRPQRPSAGSVDQLIKQTNQLQAQLDKREKQINAGYAKAHKNMQAASARLDDTLDKASDLISTALGMGASPEEKMIDTMSTDDILKMMDKI